jgi:hypothetical protein
MPARTPTPFDAMSESFDFLQKFWGSMTPGALPGRLAQPITGMLAPTVDLAELDQRITDLRAVEKWLEINAGMLRTTIQTLEVQRATIATLKGIGGAMLAPMMTAAAAPAPMERVAPAAAAVSPAVEPPSGAAPPEPGPTPARARPRKRAAPPTPSLAEDALNPAAWWQALQDQFGRIAATAASAGEPPPAPKKSPRRPAKKKARR